MKSKRAKRKSGNIYIMKTTSKRLLRLNILLNSRALQASITSLYFYLLFLLLLSFETLGSLNFIFRIAICAGISMFVVCLCQAFLARNIIFSLVWKRKCVYVLAFGKMPNFCRWNLKRFEEAENNNNKNSRQHNMYCFSVTYKVLLFVVFYSLYCQNACAVFTTKSESKGKSMHNKQHIRDTQQRMKQTAKYRFFAKNFSLTQTYTHTHTTGDY